MQLALGLFGQEAFWNDNVLLVLEVPAPLHFPLGFSPLPSCNLAEFLLAPLLATWKLAMSRSWESKGPVATYGVRR